MNMHKSFRVKELAEELYATLRAKGIDVLLDDRKERPGVMFADMELIGIPHTIVLGDRNTDNDEIEYKARRAGEKQMIKRDRIVDFRWKRFRAKRFIHHKSHPRGGFLLPAYCLYYLAAQRLRRAALRFSFQPPPLRGQRRTRSAARFLLRRQLPNQVFQPFKRSFPVHLRLRYSCALMITTPSAVIR